MLNDRDRFSGDVMLESTEPAPIEIASLPIPMDQIPGVRSLEAGLVVVEQPNPLPRLFQQAVGGMESLAEQPAAIRG